jgi:RNA-directed DNA polymerase
MAVDAMWHSGRTGQRNSNGAFIVWRSTAKKRMAVKLKAIKAELQRRKRHRTTEVDAWLRKVVLGYYQYHAVPGNFASVAHL